MLTTPPTFSAGSSWGWDSASCFDRRFEPSIGNAIDAADVDNAVTIPSFSLLYDYRCPFARLVHEHVLTAMDQGLELDVSFEPYTLSQGHVEPGHLDAWDDPAHSPSLLALEASIAVRDAFPDSFRALHRALFDARHAQGIALTTRDQLDPILEGVGLDAPRVFDIVETGEPREIVAARWRHYHDDLDVFGVPTFVFDDEDAIFVRLMNGPNPADPQASVTEIERLLDLMVNHVELNEFKHTRLSR